MYIDCKKVYLIYIVDVLVGKLLDLITISALKRREAAYIKRLEKVKGIT
jgi:hypothetical protein